MMVWAAVGCIAFAIIMMGMICAPEIAGFCQYMAACARRWFD